MERQSILLLAEQAAWARRVLAWEDRFDAHRCSSAEEARALLTGSRPWAALLIDAADHGADRDLIALAGRTGARPLVVHSPHVAVDWLALGAESVLPANFDLDDLSRAIAMTVGAARPEGEAHPLIGVTGPGGTGASTVAIALSQGLAARTSSVLLADLRRNAELHVLHHLDADGPGIGDLVEAHRTSSPDPQALLRLSPTVRRGYKVLPGLRRAVGWSSLRPRALAAAIDGLRAAYDVVVCDVDPDLEGEAEGGSFDVEERNALSRTAVANAAAVVVVGAPGAKGAHSLLRVLGELWSHGVAPDRTVAVVNRGDLTSLERLGAALEHLGGQETARLLLPELELESLLLVDAHLPEGLVDPLVERVLPLLGGEPFTSASAEPERIEPGSLGVRRRG